MSHANCACHGRRNDQRPLLAFFLRLKTRKSQQLKHFLGVSESSFQQELQLMNHRSPGRLVWAHLPQTPWRRLLWFRKALRLTTISLEDWSKLLKRVNAQAFRCVCSISTSTIKQVPLAPNQRKQCFKRKIVRGNAGHFFPLRCLCLSTNQLKMGNELQLTL